jgi:hypothetical protein
MATIEGLERQLEELTALRYMYPNPGEFTVDEDMLLLASAAVQGHVPVEDVGGPLSVSIRLPLEESESATLHATLPPEYPSVAPTVSISCTCVGADAIEIIRCRVEDAAAEAANQDREALAELLFALQEEAERLWREQRQSQLAARAQEGCVLRAPVPADSSCSKVIMVWFHHIKCLQKRRDIVSLARSSGLAGFCKPGFPGVVVVEGNAEHADNFVDALRHMRWQAMDVRWEATRRLHFGTEGLPTPFTELGEAAMGEAAAICGGAMLLVPFRTAILKLGTSNNGLHEPPAQSSLSSSSRSPPLSGKRPMGAAASIENDCGSFEEADDEHPHECVVHIDHMNDRSGYSKRLGKWSAQLGLGGRLFHGVGGGGGRSRGALLVLHGVQRGTRAFLQRLRTQTVDVDRSGRPCRERQATVLWQRPLADGRAPFEGWGAFDCADMEELRQCLEDAGGFVGTAVDDVIKQTVITVGVGSGSV